MKECKKCFVLLPKSEFQKSITSTGGLCPYCRKCNNERSLKYWHSEAGQASELRRKDKRKVYANSEAGKQARKKWRKSEKGQAWLKQRRLSNCITAGMHRSLKGNKDGLHWETLVEYSVNDLKDHLQKQFEEGMNWENHTKNGWHIDHIKPIYTFNITSYEDEEFKECWSLENLRPLWAKQNQRRVRQ